MRWTIDCVPTILTNSSAVSPSSVNSLTDLNQHTLEAETMSNQVWVPDAVFY